MEIFDGTDVWNICIAAGGDHFGRSASSLGNLIATDDQSGQAAGVGGFDLVGDILPRREVADGDWNFASDRQQSAAADGFIELRQYERSRQNDRE